MSWTLLRGDAARLPLADNSIDAICVDPPYGLEFMGKDWDKFRPEHGNWNDQKWAGKGLKIQSGESGHPEPYVGRPSFHYKANLRCRACGHWQRGGTPCACASPDLEPRPNDRMRAFQAWCEEWAREALRVLKPGGHAVCFGGTRTVHRLTCGLEDAGFEVRDSLHWMYSQGFPKSLDVGKAIDRRRVDDIRPVCRFLRAAIDAGPHTENDIAERFGFHPRLVRHWAARDTDSQPAVPTWEQWEQLKALLGFGDEMDAEVWRLNGRKGQPGEAWEQREVIGQSDWDNSANHFVPGADHAQRVQLDITAPATPEAERWQGWGTALKPSHEPIVLCRKPLIGTVAANVLAHGTGALNVDACRVNSTPANGSAGPAGRWPPNLLLSHSPGCVESGTRQVRSNAQPDGTAGDYCGSLLSSRVNGKRTAGYAGAGGLEMMPAWQCAEGCPVALLDAQSGTSKGGNPIKNRPISGYGEGWPTSRTTGGYADIGGASRFFPQFAHDPAHDAPFLYQAKASTRERNEGLGGDAGVARNSHPT